MELSTTNFYDDDPAPAVLVAAIDVPAATSDDVRSQVATAAKELPLQAKGYVVTAEELTEAHAFLKRIRTIRDRWAAFIDPHIDGAKEAKRVAEANRKRLCDDKELLDGPLVEAEKIIGGKILAVEEEAERQRAAEQARLEAEAKQQAVDHTLQAAVDLYDEAEAATVPEVKEALRAEADAILEAPVQTEAVHVPSVIPSKTGISKAENWDAEIVSLTDLLTALIGKKLDAPLAADLLKRITEAVMPPLNQRAKALKSALAIPGVRARRNKGLRIR